jgi:hypothetical protein
MRRPWEVACTSYLADGVIIQTCRFCMEPKCTS